MSDSGSISSASRKRPAAAMQRGKDKAAAAAAGAGSSSSSSGPKRRQLDTTRQGVRVWLVKVPVAVAEAIKAAQEGARVGTLTVTRSSAGGGGAAGGGGEDHRTEAVRLEEALCEKLGLPRDFTLEAPPPEAKMPRMYALRSADGGGGGGGVDGSSGSGGRGRLMVEGVVSRRTSLLPEASLDYRAFAKKRQIQHHRKERRLELIRDDWGPQQRALARAGGGGGGGGGLGGQKKAIDLLAPLGPADGSGSGGGAGAGAAGGGAGKKAKRLDEAGLRTALFRLFEERRAWRLKELVARTGQVEHEVKAGVRAIADSQLTGEYKGMWLLKPEFARRG